LFHILVAVLVTLSSLSNLGRARLFSILVCVLVGILVGILVGVLVGVLVTLSSRSNLGRARLFGMLVAVRVALSGRGTLGPGGSLGWGWGSIRTPQCRPIWGQ
jgi:hypothetical protein